MNKGSHFNGQPAYGQLINLLDKSKILQISQEKGGERYVKHFDAWQHLLIMLYAVIKRFDSLREITDSMFPEARKLAHLGISMMPRRSTLSDANARRSEGIFEAIYRDLYKTYRNELSSDSRNNPSSSWINRLQIIDSTTISLLSPEYLLSFERCPFHTETPDHYALVSYLLDLSVSQSSALLPLHSAAGYQSA